MRRRKPHPVVGCFWLLRLLDSAPPSFHAQSPTSPRPLQFGLITAIHNYLYSTGLLPSVFLFQITPLRPLPYRCALGSQLVLLRTNPGTTISPHAPQSRRLFLLPRSLHLAYIHHTLGSCREICELGSSSRSSRCGSSSVANALRKTVR